MPLHLFGYNDPNKDIYDGANQILKSLTDEDWTRFLTFMERRKFPPDSTLVQIGTPGRILFILVSGSVEVIVPTSSGAERQVDVIDEGSVFGEVAFLDGGLRSATIRALEPIEVLMLSFESFEKLLAWDPRLASILLLDVGRILSLRLRRTNAGL